MEPTFRGLTEADLPAWLTLLEAMEQVDRTGEEFNEEDLRETLADPNVDPERDRVGAFLEGRLVGLYTVFKRLPSATEQAIWLGGGVAPDHRGQGWGTQLLTRMLERAREVHRAEAPDVAAAYLAEGISDNQGQAELFAEHGLEPWRYEFQMRRDLLDLPDRLPLPEGLRAGPLDIDADGPRLLAAHNVAFADLPGFSPWDEAMWQQWVVGSRSSRHEHSLLVTDEDGAIAGYLMTSEFDAYTESSGRREAWVSRIGTMPQHRGRGLGQALLTTALHEYAAAGYDEAALSVDTENPSGALGIYRRSGFEVERRFTMYRLEEAPGR